MYRGYDMNRYVSFILFVVFCGLASERRFSNYQIVLIFLSYENIFRHENAKSLLCKKKENDSHKITKILDFDP